MGEYEEDSDFNDLIGTDSEDEEDKAPVNRAEEDNLLSVEDVHLSDRPIRRLEKDLLFLPGMLSDDDEDEEDSKDDIADKDPKEDILNKAKLQKLLHTEPPGINLFRKTSSIDGESGFKYFNLDTLNLETDFGYDRRGKLLKYGFTDERLNEMFRDRFEFVRHLFPEAQSVLICNQKDFQAIMNFLFYSISVSTDLRITELMTKAFFDLRKNYGFRWNLSLSHIVTCLLNYGADEAAVYNLRFYQKHLDKHLEAVRRTGQKVSKKYELPKLPEFVAKKRSELSMKPDISQHVLPVSEAGLKFCLVNFFEMISNFSAGCTSHLEFRNKHDWSDEIVLIYLLMVAATDKRIICHYKVRESVMTAIHYHLDSFSSSQWYWGPDKTDQPKTLDGHKDFNHSNVCKSLIIILNEFFPGELCPETVTWTVIEEHSSKVSFRKANASDHHLNMLYRLSLIPPSLRGNQFKKYLAFMYLQTIAEISYITPTHVDVLDVGEVPDLSDQPSPGLRILVKARNYEVLMSVVELYDTIIGHEPSMDFTPDKLEAIEKILRNVLQWMEKKLPNISAISLEDPKSIQGIKLSEFLGIVISRIESNTARR